ncbi:MAG: hypothetical protein IKL51_00215 [Lachnospiraceae bacterium]|nr:hypothetical protein [Lachnospiraceae bacterium]
MSQELNMSVSGVCTKENKQYAFVTFSDGIREAEGRIPECVIISNRGFEEEQVKQLENYMRRELKTLKKMAAGIRLIDALN